MNTDNYISGSDWAWEPFEGPFEPFLDALRALNLDQEQAQVVQEEVDELRHTYEMLERYLRAVVSLPEERYGGETAGARDALAILEGKAVMPHGGKFAYLSRSEET